MHLVMASSTKGDRVNMRIDSDVKEDALAAAFLRGLNLTAWINSLLVKEINDDKQNRPELFADAKRKVSKATASVTTVSRAQRLKRSGRQSLPVVRAKTEERPRKKRTK